MMYFNESLWKVYHCISWHMHIYPMWRVANVTSFMCGRYFPIGIEVFCMEVVCVAVLYPDHLDLRACIFTPKNICKIITFCRFDFS